MTGTERAAKRLSLQRAFTTKRLAKAPKATPTRQQTRADARREGKMPIGTSQKGWHRLKGYSK